MPERKLQPAESTFAAFPIALEGFLAHAPACVETARGCRQPEEAHRDAARKKEPYASPTPFPRSLKQGHLLLIAYM